MSIRQRYADTVEYIYLHVVMVDQMAEKKNYWEMQKSFWKTPTGIATWILLLAAILGGGLLALNILGSPYPVIESFRADPVVVSPGGVSNLSWSVIGASQVEIERGVGKVELKGSMQVKPTETTTYRLTAINGSINRSTTLRILVQQP
ncbi:MAG: hypothetical protein M0Q13_03055 [Methanothrix sp.]|nr:hypothetical protein [Methanothrix sp.]